jgi:hypothetical protein
MRSPWHYVLVVPLLLLQLVLSTRGFMPGMPLHAMTVTGAQRAAPLSRAAHHANSHAHHATTPNPVTHGADVAAQGAADDVSTPAPREVPSHTDGGCHAGSPCCVPTLLAVIDAAVAAPSLVNGRIAPMCGPSLVVWTRGTVRQPPATAPPTRA